MEMMFSGLVASRAALVSWILFALVAAGFIAACRAFPDRPADRWRHRYAAAVYQQRQIHKGILTPPPVSRPAWRAASWLEPIRSWDHEAFRRVNGNWCNRVFEATMPVLTHLGDGLVQAVFLMSLLVWAISRRRLDWKVTAVLAFVALIVGICAPLLKLALPRYRPASIFPYDIVLLIKPLYGGSFPSGHTMVAFGVATVIGLRHHWALPWAMGLAFLVGLSRISVGVHFPLDVIVSAALGTLLSVMLVRTHHSQGALQAGSPEEIPDTVPAAP